MRKFYTYGNPVPIGSQVQKFAHLSVDDCLFWKDLIASQDAYTSAFEQPNLAFYKRMHDQYGICITLNCFCTSGDYSISNVPSKFAEEFQANAHWLRFAFHAEAASVRYGAAYMEDPAASAAASYNAFVAAMKTMTGTYDCIDRITRLGYYVGDEDVCLALRDCDCGIVGLLAADDERISYYLSADDAHWLAKHPFFTDGNRLTFFRTQPRLENQADPAYLQNAQYANYDKCLELFTHEGVVTDEVFEAYCQWCCDNGYTFAFMQDVLGLY